MGKQKYYVVWNGHNPGIYNSWTDCQLQTKGFPGAIFKSFDTRAEAEAAYSNHYQYNFTPKNSPKSSPGLLESEGEVPYIENSLAVDAACSGNPGPMEYRGVHVASKQQLFHFGPMKGTNNIGEFLAIVHGLALFKKQSIDMPIYSDSLNAINWVRQKKCKTKLERNKDTEQLFQLIERAEKWLNANEYSTPILKWETKLWGEIPADFGRK